MVSMCTGIQSLVVSLKRAGLTTDGSSFTTEALGKERVSSFRRHLLKPETRNFFRLLVFLPVPNHGCLAVRDSKYEPIAVSLGGGAAACHPHCQIATRFGRGFHSSAKKSRLDSAAAELRQRTRPEQGKHAMLGNDAPRGGGDGDAVSGCDEGGAFGEEKERGEHVGEVRERLLFVEEAAGEEIGEDIG